MTDIVLNFKTAGQEVVIGALRQIGSAAVDGLGKALSVVADFAADSFKGALDAQKGIDEFSAALQRAGKDAPITSDAALALSQSLKNLTGGSDDTILAMETIGLRFDKIGKDTFPRFITSSADLAAKLKMGPEQAAVLLGKTLQDLSTDGTASIGRLRAAGLTLTDDQEKLIKKLVATGDAAGAQKVLLDALAETTGGAAADAADTLQGRWAIFQETIADAGEGIAMELLPALTKLADAVLPALVPMVETVAEAMRFFLEQIVGGASVSDAIKALGDIPWEDVFGPQIGEMIYTTINFLSEFAAQAQTFITGVVVPAFQSAVAWIQANWPAIQATIADVWAQTQIILLAVWDYIQTTVVPAFQSAVDWVIANWPMIQAKIAEVWAAVQPVLQAIWDFIQGTVIPAFQSAVDWVVQNWPQIQATAEEVWKAISTAVDTAIKAIKDIWAIFQPAFEGDFKTFGANLRKGFDESWEAIKKAVGDAIDWFGKQDWGKIGTDILKGIAAGITAATEFVASAARAAAQAAIDTVKGFLGIQSPSKVFAGLGQNMMAGMAQGIAGAANMPAQAAQVAAATAVSTVNNYNLTVTSSQSSMGVMTDFALMRALAGV